MAILTLALALPLTLELRPSPFLLALGPSPLTSKPPMTTEGKLKRSRNPLDFDFTEPEALTRYVTETGKILPRKLTGLTARQQRHIAKAVKRARNMITMK
jgi:small subunit ribosomal protein S18